MSNPFEINNSGPRFGNAYDNSSISSPPPTFGGVGSPALPPRTKPHPTPDIAQNSSPYGTQRMPSPSDYHQTATTNAWQESNKTLDENRTAWSPSPQNAYQYSGTPYGNTSIAESAYSPQPAAAALNTNDHSNKIESPMTVTDNEATYNNSHTSSLPSKLRFISRIVLFIAAVGHLGFAAGASPFSGEPVPFDSSACFYFLFAVAIFSIIYSGYHIILYLFRRFGKAEKIKRAILILCDLFMALLWGIGIIVEIAKYNCPPGQHNGWCNFYNTSIFFGFISFVLYVVTLVWDAVGGCLNRKK